MARFFSNKKEKGHIHNGNKKWLVSFCFQSIYVRSFVLFSILQYYFCCEDDDDDDDDSSLACMRQSLETQMATFSYSFLTLLYNAEMSLLQKSPPSIYPSIPPSLPILFAYLFFTSPHSSACYCCSWVMSIIVVQIAPRNTHTVQRKTESEREQAKKERLLLSFSIYP